MALVLDGTTGVTYTGFTGATTNFTVPLNIGVGTASPLTGIHLESSTSESNRTLRIGYDGTYYATIAQGGAAGVYYRAFGGLHHIWEVGGTEYMRINNSGSVGIGTTNTIAYDAVAVNRPLVVARSDTSTSNIGSAASITISNLDTTTNNVSQINFAAITGANTNHFSSAIISSIHGARTNGQYPTGILTFSTSTSLNSAPSEKLRLGSAGGMSLGTTATGVAGEFRATNAVTAFYSDRRLKTEISRIENALDKIDQLAGVIYTQNKLAEEFGYNDYSEQVGLYADDVKRVQPQVVKPAPFDLNDDNTSKSGENYLTVQYEKLVPLLVEGIKELRQEINALKGQ